MLGALAAVALVVSTLGATASVTQTNEQALEQDREPVLEIQAIESMDAFNE